MEAALRNPLLSVKLPGMRRCLIILLAIGVIGEAWAKNHAGDVINLSIWKLTIPMDDNGDGKADEVIMPALRLFEDPDFFRLSEKQDCVIFRAQCGAATTENSDYPRSELREMKKGGTKETSWGTNDGKVHNLTISAAITAVPAEKQHVVCAQIHGAEDDLLMVRLEGKKLFIERNELDRVMLDDNYELGSFFNLMIIADNGRIRALYERKQVMEWNVDRDGLYFKVGCYTQSNTKKGDKPDAYGETAFKSVFVTHK